MALELQEYKENHDLYFFIINFFIDLNFGKTDVLTGFNNQKDPKSFPKYSIGNYHFRRNYILLNKERKALKNIMKI